MEIRNAPGAALAVDTGAAVRVPYAIRASDFSDHNNVIQDRDVPAGHIFVIEYITAEVT